LGTNSGGCLSHVFFGFFGNFRGQILTDFDFSGL
jgi:hypothetical protein